MRISFDRCVKAQIAGDLIPAENRQKYPLCVFFLWGVDSAQRGMFTLPGTTVNYQCQRRTV